MLGKFNCGELPGRKIWLLESSTGGMNGFVVYPAGPIGPWVGSGIGENDGLVTVTTPSVVRRRRWLLVNIDAGRWSIEECGFDGCEVREP